MKLEKRKILITGGAGFIGSHLTDKLVSLDNEVVIVDNLSSGRMDFLTENKDKIEVQNVDLLKKDALLPILEGCDAVFHLAANPMVKISEDQTRLHIDLPPPPRFTGSRA
jgi:UDP-glucose 4-epimerase